MDTENIDPSPTKSQQEQDGRQFEESETMSVMQDVREYEPNLGMLDPQNLKDWLEGSDAGSQSESDRFGRQSALGSFKEGQQDMSTFNQTAVESTLFDILKDERLNDDKFEFDDNETQKMGEELLSELQEENPMMGIVQSQSDELIDQYEDGQR